MIGAFVAEQGPVVEPSCEVVVAGAGPVGLVTAAVLVESGIRVTVLEAEPALPRNLRASTFHPPTLDMLDDLGVAAALTAIGLRAPRFQYRDRHVGLLAEFDFALIGDRTRHPYRVQCEQYKLNELLLAKLARYPEADVRFGARVAAVEQTDAGVAALVGGRGWIEGRYLVGADGAASQVRQSLGIPFEGFTWPERFLVASTGFDFTRPFPDLSAVNYFADPQEWYFLLQVPGLWRVMFPTRPEESDEAVLSEPEVQRRLRRVHDPGRPLPVRHRTLYRVHQRVATRYRRGRAFLAGDAAHINNPLGGMGMNGGIHDAVNLAGKLAAVLRDGADPGLLERYEAERRPVALEYINTHTIRNKRNLEARDPAEQAAFRRTLAEAVADPAKAREMLLRVSMIASLETCPGAEAGA